ncbi:hypothetical protein ACWEKR_07140 [Nocardia sp. NPDC004573]
MASPAPIASALLSLRAEMMADNLLAPADLEIADAVIFVADTDGKQHQYR